MKKERSNLKKLILILLGISLLLGGTIFIIHKNNKNTKEEFIFPSMRKCEKFTGVDRHRIKTFLRNEKPNYTDYNFEIIDE